MRRFKKATEKSGVLADARKHEFFEKPGVKAKKKSIEAQKRANKRGRKGEAFEKKSNQNFRFNKDHTQKIPLAPRKPEFKKKPTYNNPQNSSRPNRPVVPRFNNQPKRRPTER
jgi:small subunit ribosomal protein S21